MRMTVLLACCALGCATASNSDPDAPTHEVVKRTLGPGETLDLTRQTVIRAGDYRAEPGRVWTELLAVGAQLGLPVQSSDSSTGMIVFHLPASTGRIAGRPASDWIECGRAAGGLPRAETYQITLSLTAVVSPGEQVATHVRTSLVAYARERGTGNAGLPCSSTGRLEQHLLTTVGARVAT